MRKINYVLVLMTHYRIQHWTVFSQRLKGTAPERDGTVKGTVKGTVTVSSRSNGTVEETVPVVAYTNERLRKRSFTGIKPLILSKQTVKER